MSKKLSRLHHAAVAALMALPVCNRALAQEAPPPGLLQKSIEGSGYDGGFFKEYDLHLAGHVEAGAVYTCHDTPGGEMGVGRLFDSKREDPTFHQFEMTLWKQAAPSGSDFDWGFTLDVMYGADARYTQANGTNFYGSGVANRQVPLASSPNILVIVPGQQYPENQIDILQANIQFNLPVGQGLVVTAGKFVPPWGQEHIDATKNLLYSHSYMFGISQPMTLTGVTLEAPVSSELSVMGGLVLGWDQALEDNNDWPSILAQVKYASPDGWRFALSGLVGPEQPDNRSDIRWLFDATLDFDLTETIHLGFEGVFGSEPGVSTSIASNGARLWGGSGAHWSGAAVYAKYEIDPAGVWTLVARGEYFNDSAGARQIISEIYSGTVGVNIVPFQSDPVGSHLMIRPEIRWDWATDKIFDGGTRDTQISLGADIIFDF